MTTTSATLDPPPSQPRPGAPGAREGSTRERITWMRRVRRLGSLLKETAMQWDEDQAARLVAELDPAWKREGTTTLRRRLRFEDFKDAFGFATRIALVAEEEGHHPDMEIGWGKVVVALTTHSSGGLTRNDFIMAAKIDRLAAGTGLKEA